MAKKKSQQQRDFDAGAKAIVSTPIAVQEKQNWYLIALEDEEDGFRLATAFAEEEARYKSERRQETIKGIAELFVEGRLVRVLDADGKPLMRMNRQGEMEQVLKAREGATPEELAYWHAEQSSNFPRPNYRVEVEEQLQLLK